MKSENLTMKNSSNYIYGRLPALNCLATSKVKQVFLQDNFSDKKLLAEINKKGLKPIFKSLNELNKITNNGNHQGIVLEVYPHEYSSLEEIIQSAKGKK